MRFERFIAKRYLISRHKINFISVISFISIAGITLGVAALIVVLSVFNGFSSLVTSFLMSFDPHLRIEVLASDFDRDETERIIRQTPDLYAASPFITGKVLAYRRNHSQIVNLKGITPESAERIYELDKNTVLGRDELGEDKSGTQRIIIGLRLADRLQVITGDTLTLISPAGIESAVTQFSLPMMRSFKVTGIFSSNNNDYDEGFIFCSLEAVQNLLGYEDSYQGYEIRLNDMDNTDEAKEFLEEKLDNSVFAVNTWFDFHRDLYSVMQMERWAAYIILSLIILVATFNILGSLSMSVIEKRRDIGILRSIGVEEKSVLRIFMFEGLLIGLIGTAAGALLGYLVAFLQIKYNIYPLDPTQYKIDSLPLEVRAADFFFVAGMSMLLSFLASLYPAKRAAKVNPVEAIKWE
jgi:lipoprotein-releasing system permease protein